MEDGDGILRPRRPSDFDAMYECTPPWDIGRPQSCFVELASDGLIVGRVLDVGCGTGEHALLAAAMSLEAYGLDVSKTAIERARQKALDHGLKVQFVVGSALDLAAMDTQFDTVIDSGLYHVLEECDRKRFITSLETAIRPGGRYYLLCFSDEQPGDWGPRRVSKQEILSNFNAGWDVESIVPAKMALSVSPDGALAWQATITRVCSPQSTSPH